MKEPEEGPGAERLERESSRHSAFHKLMFFLQMGSNCKYIDYLNQK